MNEEKKMIRILSRGPIRELSGIYGPILNEYNERITTVLKLLLGGHKVLEVLTDGTTVALSLTNYNIDNSVKPTPIEVKEVPKSLEDIKPQPTIQNQKKEFNNKFNRYSSGKPVEKTSPLTEEASSTESPKPEIQPDVTL
jgi:hypothetical protein